MEKAKNITLAILMVLLVCSIFFNVHQYVNTRNRTYRDTMRLTWTDTIPYYKPVPKDSTVIRYITEVLPVVPDTGNNRGENIPDSCKNDDIFISDSVKVSIPITSKVYEDSTYRAYVSGYHANLDSIFIYPEHEVLTIIQKNKRKRWGIGLHAGYGFGINGRISHSPYIGIGISYNLITF